MLDALLFVVNTMLEQLILRATARVFALASVTITLKLEGSTTHVRTVRPALPSNDRQLWLKLMEDETGIANVIVTPDLYERDRLVVTRSKFLLVEGALQNQDNVIHIKATRLTALSDAAIELQSHDFH